jgi:hypothetical protein
MTNGEIKKVILRTQNNTFKPEGHFNLPYATGRIGA